MEVQVSASEGHKDVITLASFTLGDVQSNEDLAADLAHGLLGLLIDHGAEAGIIRYDNSHFTFVPHV